MNRAKRGGIWAGAVAAGFAAVSAAVVADRRVRATRTQAVLDDFAAPEPARAGFVRTDDAVSLYYEQDGPLNAPLTVVLLHGFCQNRDDLLFQRRADHRPVRPPGTGRQLRPAQPRPVLARQRRPRHHRPARLRPARRPERTRAPRARRAHRPLDGRHDDPRARRRAPGTVRQADPRRRTDQHVDRQAHVAHPGRPRGVGARRRSGPAARAARSAAADHPHRTRPWPADRRGVAVRAPTRVRPAQPIPHSSSS